MKYYYNGKKVRTSDNLYTHAIIKGEKVIACCSRYDLAVKRLNQEINYFNKDIASNEIFLQEAIFLIRYSSYQLYINLLNPLNLWFILSPVEIY